MGGGFNSPMKLNQINNDDKNYGIDNVATFNSQTASAAVGNNSPRIRSSHAGRAKHAQERRDKAIKPKSKAENVKIQMILHKLDSSQHVGNDTEMHLALMS